MRSERVASISAAQQILVLVVELTRALQVGECEEPFRANVVKGPCLPDHDGYATTLYPALDGIIGTEDKKPV
jgi:hypothetical protein